MSPEVASIQVFTIQKEKILKKRPLLFEVFVKRKGGGKQWDCSLF